MWREKYEDEKNWLNAITITILWLILVILFMFSFYWFFIRNDKVNKYDDIPITKNTIKTANQYAKESFKIIEDFKIDSGIKGVFVSNAFSAPLYAKTKSAEKGIQTAIFFAGIQNDLDNNLSLIHNMKNILELDLHTAFQGSKDRGKAVNDYISNLQKLQKEGEIASKNLNGEITLLNKNLDYAKNNTKMYEAYFFTSLDNFDYISTKKNLKEFKNAKYFLVENRADIGLKIAIQDRLNYYLPLIKEQILYAENNREKIIMNCI